jgi:hypothetical protein
MKPKASIVAPFCSAQARRPRERRRNFGASTIGRKGASTRVRDDRLRNSADVRFFDYYINTHAADVRLYGKSISRFELRAVSRAQTARAPPYVATITIWIADGPHSTPKEHQAGLRADVKFTNRLDRQRIASSAPHHRSGSFRGEFCTAIVQTPPRAGFGRTARAAAGLCVWDRQSPKQQARSP